MPSPRIYKITYAFPGQGTSESFKINAPDEASARFLGQLRVPPGARIIRVSFTGHGKAF